METRETGTKYIGPEPYVQQDKTKGYQNKYKTQGNRDTSLCHRDFYFDSGSCNLYLHFVVIEISQFALD